MKVQRTRNSDANKTVVDTLIVIGGKAFEHYKEVVHNTTVEPRKVFVSWSISDYTGKKELTTKAAPKCAEAL